MSRRREIGRRLNTLTDIAGILSAMRGLALMETRILGEFLECQRRMVAGIELAAADFLAWHPQYQAPPGERHELWVLVGSEQGFCGDFNEVIEADVRGRSEGAAALSRWVLVGRRLAERLGDDPRTVRCVPGATVASEVPGILLNLTRELTGLLTATNDPSGFGLSTLYHDDANGELRLRHLLPLRNLPEPHPHAFGPELNLPLARFVKESTAQYLYAALNDVLYTSLMAENRRRFAHMDRAIDRLDTDIGRLRLAYNTQRQEEITEEIEVILLSATMVASGLMEP